MNTDSIKHIKNLISDTVFSSSGSPEDIDRYIDAKWSELIVLDYRHNVRFNEFDLCLFIPSAVEIYKEDNSLKKYVDIAKIYKVGDVYVEYRLIIDGIDDFYCLYYGSNANHAFEEFCCNIFTKIY